ncbi:MAG: hypothetical protein LKI53_07340 [Bacteroidales bacterium]|jgi:hypothetical protein|nr:hypothetical protein [Bacteroidales bacterium]
MKKLNYYLLTVICIIATACGKRPIEKPGHNRTAIVVFHNTKQTSPAEIINKHKKLPQSYYSSYINTPVICGFYTQLKDSLKCHSKYDYIELMLSYKDDYLYILMKSGDTVDVYYDKDGGYPHLKSKTSDLLSRYYNFSKKVKYIKTQNISEYKKDLRRLYTASPISNREDQYYKYILNLKQTNYLINNTENNRGPLYNHRVYNFLNDAKVQYVSYLLFLTHTFPEYYLVKKYDIPNITDHFGSHKNYKAIFDRIIEDKHIPKISKGIICYYYCILAIKHFNNTDVTKKYIEKYRKISGDNYHASSL